MCLAALVEAQSIDVLSPPEFVRKKAQYKKIYSKYSTFHWKNMIEMVELPFWKSFRSIPLEKNSSADSLRCETSFTHQQIFSLLTSLGDMPQLEEASNFKKSTHSIHGDPIYRKNVRTSLHRRKTNGGLSVIRDIGGSQGENSEEHGSDWTNFTTKSTIPLKY